MTAASRRAVFLDRDGVLIEAVIRDRKPFAATSQADVHVIAGVPEACYTLSELGFLLVMVTNQPDIARGKISRQFVDDTNAALAARLALDAVQVCDHDNADNCACRKPQPGLITSAAKTLSIDLASSIVVGDRWRDIEAGKRAGCKTIFVDYGYDEQRPAAPDHIATSLPAAIGWIRDQI